MVFLSSYVTTKGSLRIYLLCHCELVYSWTNGRYASFMNLDLKASSIGGLFWGSGF